MRRSSGPGALSRRGLLGAGVAVAGVGMAGTAAVASESTATTSHEPKPTTRTGLDPLRPRKLRSGDTVRVVSPAGTPDRAMVGRGVQILESWGLRVQLAEHVFDDLSYLAGTDEDRLADLNAALRDPDVRAVFASRGGSGSARIVDGMDVSAALRDPKPLIGFSDITVLQLALWRHCRLATIHGPMVNWNDDRTGPESIEALRASLMTTDPVLLKRDPENETSRVEVPGTAEGRVLGGNLSMIAASVGGTGFPNLADAILLIEDVGEPPYHVDRFLTQLRNAGALKRIAGVAIGQFVDSVGNPGDWTIVELLRDRVGDLGVPVLGGLPIGHGVGQLTVPFGTNAFLDTSAGTLTVESGVR